MERASASRSSRCRARLVMQTRWPSAAKALARADPRPSPTPTIRQTPLSITAPASRSVLISNEVGLESEPSQWKDRGMKWNTLSDEPCSVARTVAVIGDRWTLMLLRDCFLGIRRFEDFERRLGISRSIVAERLRGLVDEGVLRREAYQDRPVRH